MLSNMEQSILGEGGSLEEAVKQQNAQLAFQDSITASSVLKDTVCLFFFFKKKALFCFSSTTKILEVNFLKTSD